MLAAKNIARHCTINVKMITVSAGKSRVIVEMVARNETQVCLFEAKCATFCMLLKHNYACIGNRLHFCFFHELKPCERKPTMVN